MSDERQIFSLQQVVTSIKRTIEGRYQQAYWVKAEMHKLNQYPSGHAFPELVQKEDDKIVAQMSATIWKDNLKRINAVFIEKAKEPLKEGVMLLMQVKVVFSELYGLSLQILDIDPTFTLGELQKEREETLKRLQKDGLLNSNQQLDLPLLPQRIAVISADSSKGLSDFNKVLLGNPWNYHFFTMLFPAYLQGDVAVASIIGQLERIRKVKDHFDAVVIVRGGGGEVGMSCYNRYELCRSIATFPLPVLTGIGHSTNMTVAEMIAYRNAITPTELADFLLQTFHDFAVPVQEASKKITLFSRRLLEQSTLQFEAETKHFKNAAELFLSRANHELTHASQQFRSEVRSVVIGSHERLVACKKGLTYAVENVVKHETRFLQEVQLSLPIWTERKLFQEQTNLQRIEDLVRVLDPLNVLRRGYAIARLNGQTIHNGNIPKEGDSIEIETEHKRIDSTVKAVRFKS